MEQWNRVEQEWNRSGTVEQQWNRVEQRVEQEWNSDPSPIHIQRGGKVYKGQ